jgi:hypothetical protein
MSGAHPEVKPGTMNKELARLEQQYGRKPRKGTLAARVAQERKAAEKAMRAAEIRLANARRAESILRTAPDLTEKQLVALVRKKAR